jgi:hypothetical protein
MEGFLCAGLVAPFWLLADGAAQSAMETANTLSNVLDRKNFLFIV